MSLIGLLVFASFSKWDDGFVDLISLSVDRVEDNFLVVSFDFSFAMNDWVFLIKDGEGDLHFNVVSGVGFGLSFDGFDR